MKSIKLEWVYFFTCIVLSLPLIIVTCTASENSVTFVVNKVAVWQVCLSVCLSPSTSVSPLTSIVPPMLHTHSLIYH
jgi:hypothetical protein